MGKNGAAFRFETEKIDESGWISAPPQLLYCEEAKVEACTGRTFAARPGLAVGPKPGPCRPLSQGKLKQTSNFLMSL